MAEMKIQASVEMKIQANPVILFAILFFFNDFSNNSLLEYKPHTTSNQQQWDWQLCFYFMFLCFILMKLWRV